VTERSNDPTLDHELRDALRRRDPGAAPSALRRWVLDVTEEAERAQPPQPRRAFVAALSVAAVILLAVIVLVTIRHIGGPVGTGSTVSEVSRPSPSAVEAPLEAFDPTLEGAGISATQDLSPALIVFPTCAILVVLALTVRGRRRLVPAALATVLGGWAAIAALVPAPIGAFAYGPGLNVEVAPQAPGSEEELLYEIAPANGRFSAGIGILADGPLPIRIEGIVSPPFDGVHYRDHYIGMLLTAMWIDREVNGGMSGPDRPFAAFDLPPNGQAIWLVGRAGVCALGSAFDPLHPEGVGGFASIDSIDLRVSVLGWPRTIHLALPFRLVEPNPQSCPGPARQPTSSTSTEPSTH
jgi:hypothetical protein